MLRSFLLATRTLYGNALLRLRHVRTRFLRGLPFTSTHALKKFVDIVVMSFGNGVFDFV
jgi:hypothetical protein